MHCQSASVNMGFTASAVYIAWLIAGSPRQRLHLQNSTAGGMLASSCPVSLWKYLGGKMLYVVR